MERPMEKTLIPANEGHGIHCNAWNYSGRRMAGGTPDGHIHIFDGHSQSSAQFQLTSKFKAHSASVLKIVWAPPVYGDVIASCSVDGTILLWEEVANNENQCHWKLCSQFQDTNISALDMQFAEWDSRLKFIIAFVDGHIKIYESLDALDLNQWQLQATFLNVNDATTNFVKCSATSASIAWKSYGSYFQQPAFILGFNSDIPEVNVPKLWVFEDIHQRWKSIAELASSGEEGDPVTAISWAPNIGRPYELIAVASMEGISLWHVELSEILYERRSLTRVAVLKGHDGEVWLLDWDMSGMSLASSAKDGVRIWQSNTKGDWQQVAVVGSN